MAKSYTDCVYVWWGERVQIYCVEGVGWRVWVCSIDCTHRVEDDKIQDSTNEHLTF